MNRALSSQESQMALALQATHGFDYSLSVQDTVEAQLDVDRTLTERLSALRVAEERLFHREQECAVREAVFEKALDAGIHREQERWLKSWLEKDVLPKLPKPVATHGVIEELQRHATDLDAERVRLKKQAFATHQEHERLDIWASELKAREEEILRRTEDVRKENADLRSFRSGIEEDTKTLKNYQHTLETQRVLLEDEYRQLEKAKVSIDRERGQLQRLQVEMDTVSKDLEGRSKKLDEKEAALERRERVVRSELERLTSKKPPTPPPSKPEMISVHVMTDPIRLESSIETKAPQRSRRESVEARSRSVQVSPKQTPSSAHELLTGELCLADGLEDDDTGTDGGAASASQATMGERRSPTIQSQENLSSCGHDMLVQRRVDQMVADRESELVSLWQYVELQRRIVDRQAASLVERARVLDRILPAKSIVAEMSHRVHPNVMESEDDRERRKAQQSKSTTIHPLLSFSA